MRSLLPVVRRVLFLLRVVLLAGTAALCASFAHAAAPVAVDDDFDVFSGQTLSDFLSVNDTGLDGPADTYSRTTAAINGAVIVNPDGSFTYTPNVGFSGTDTFDYQIDDGAGGISSATVTAVSYTHLTLPTIYSV